MDIAGGCNRFINCYDSKKMMLYSPNTPWRAPWVLAGDEAHQATPSEDDVSIAERFFEVTQAIGFPVFLGPLSNLAYNIYEIMTPENTDPTFMSQYFARHPGVKEEARTIVNSVIKRAEGVFQIIPNVLDTTNTLVKILPWLIGGLVVAAVVFAFKNPDVIKYAA